MGVNQLGAPVPTPARPQVGYHPRETAPYSRTLVPWAHPPQTPVHRGDVTLLKVHVQGHPPPREAHPGPSTYLKTTLRGRPTSFHLSLGVGTTDTSTQDLQVHSARKHCCEAGCLTDCGLCPYFSARAPMSRGPAGRKEPVSVAGSAASFPPPHRGRSTGGPTPSRKPGRCPVSARCLHGAQALASSAGVGSQDLRWV